jgi:hypothetical protein
MKSIILIFLIISCFKCEAQFTKIPISKFYNQAVKNIVCIDSNGNITKYCPLELNHFHINIYIAFLNKKTKEMHLIGRVYLIDTVNGSGLAGLEIFRASKNNNKLINKNFLGQTTYSRDSSNNDGFFDVKFTIRKNESLFFFYPAFRLQEYSLSNF